MAKHSFEFKKMVVMQYLEVNILVRRSRRSGVARATIPDLGSHHLLLI